MTEHVTDSFIADISLRKAAIIAGFGYLIIFILGIFANFFILGNLVVPEDAAATVNNILTNSGQFRLGILGFTVMVIFDVIVAWALYILFKPVNRSLSLLSAWLRLVNATIFGVALYNLLGVLQLAGGADYPAVFEIGQLQAQTMLYLNAFNNTWLIGLIFFGVHLLLLGYLITRSDYVPGFIGILLIVASFGYLIDSFAYLLLPNYADYAAILMLIVVVPGVIGELSFTLWLLLKGSKLPETEIL